MNKMLTTKNTKGTKNKAYPKYKPSGVEWLGDMPEHWEVKAIKWTTPVFRGASPRPIDDPVYFDDEGEYAWVRIADVTASNIYLEETTQRLSDIGSSLSVKMQPGSLFLSIAGTVGMPCITKIKCCIHDGFVYFPRSKSDTKFMYYIFACGEPYKGLGKMGTQLNLNTDTVGSIIMGFPPLPEQKAIATFLDRETGRIDSLIAKKQRLLELLAEQRTALISRAVIKGLDATVKLKPSGVEWIGDVPEHWEVTRLKYLVTLKSGEGITVDDIEDSGEYPVYGGNGFRGYTSNFTHNGHIVLIGRQGALCGNVNYANGKFWASEHAVVATPCKPLVTFWLGELLRLMNLNQYSISAAQPGLAIDRIKELLIPLPPLPEQQAIATFLDRETAKIDKLFAKVNTVIERLKEYRTALISSAVTGKIDVTTGFNTSVREAL